MACSPGSATAKCRPAPGLVHPSAAVEGSLELSVKRAGEPPKHYVLISSGGKVEIQERPAPEADARVAGDEAAWIEALGPEASRSRLTVTGDSRLADALLDGLSAAGAAAGVAAVNAA